MNAVMQARRAEFGHFTESRGERRAAQAQALIAEVRRMNWRHDEFTLLLAAIAENAHAVKYADLSIVEGHLQEAFESMDDVFARSAS
jgi:hypothetical protein